MDQVTDPKPDGTTHDAPQAPPPLGPSPDVREVLYRAVALGVVIFILIAVIIGAIVLIGTGAISQLPAGPVPAVTTVTATTATAVPTISLPSTTAPVEILPANLQVAVSVEPKTIAGMVTVNFLGGKGRAQVKEIQGRLTYPDGTVVTGSINAQTEFPQLILQGSKATDQLEVFALMTSGKTYKILDQKVIYPTRY